MTLVHDDGRLDAQIGPGSPSGSRAGHVLLVGFEPERAHLFSTLMALRRDPDGHLAFRGRACHAAPLQRDILIPETVDAWAPSPFAAGVEDDRTLAIRRA